MLLPHDLQHFPTPQLMVVADHVNAHFYLVGGDAVEEVASVGEPKERKSDKELNTEPSEDDAERVHRLANEIKESIERFTRDHQVTQIHLVMKADLANAIKKHLDAPTTTKLGLSLAMDAANETPLEIIKRLLEARL